jgi:hypothetical protein
LRLLSFSWQLFAWEGFSGKVSHDTNKHKCRQATILGMTWKYSL